MRNKAQTSISERQKFVQEGYEDPMVNIVMSFQSLQKSLEKELGKFEQIGKEIVSLSDDIGLDSGSWEEPSPDLKTDEAISFNGLHFDDTRQGGFHGRPTHVIKLNEVFRVPESNPREVSAGTTPLESQDFALESTSSRHGNLKKVVLESPEDKCGHMEMELKLEDLFTQKIEAEVEYLVVSRANQRLNVARVDQLSLLEEQKCLANEQIQILHRLGDAESKSIVLKSQMLGLEASCAELLATEQVLIMQTRVCVQTLYFFAQFLLLLACVWLFLLQLFPRSFRVVPT